MEIFYYIITSAFCWLIAGWWFGGMLRAMREDDIRGAVLNGTAFLFTIVMWVMGHMLICKSTL